MDLFKDIAAHLGGTFIPMGDPDEKVFEDRGWIFLGDINFWRTPQIFLHKDCYRSKGRIEVSVNPYLRFMKEGRLSYHHPEKLGYSDSITVSYSRTGADIALDIKRRLLTPYLEKLPALLAAVEQTIATRVDRAAWCAKVGIDLEAGRGRVWRGKDSAYAEITQVGSDVTMKLNWISKDKAEAIIKFLKENEG